MSEQILGRDIKVEFPDGNTDGGILQRNSNGDFEIRNVLQDVFKGQVQNFDALPDKATYVSGGGADGDLYSVNEDQGSLATLNKKESGAYKFIEATLEWKFVSSVIKSVDNNLGDKVTKGAFTNNQILRGDGTDTAQGSNTSIDDNGRIQATSFDVMETDAENIATRLTSDINEGFLQMWNDGTQKVQIRSGGNSYFNGGNVAFGKTTATEKIDVAGEVKATVDSVEHKLSEKAEVSDLNGAIGNVSSPLLDLPLQNSLTMKAGAGAVTFNRSTTATYIDRYGIMQNASVDEARFEKDGLLIEGESTNLALYSDDYTNWISNGDITITNDTSVYNKYGVLGMPKIVNDTDAIERIVNTYQNPIASPVTGNSYATSVFVKSGSISTIRFRWYDSAGFLGDCRVNISTGTIVGGSLTDTTKLKLEYLSNNIVRVSYSYTYHRSDTNLVAELYTSSDDGNTPVIGDYIYVDGFQFEELPFVTSYIPTTTTTVTRSADVCYLDFNNNCPEFINSDFAFHVEFDTPPVAYSQYRQVVAMSYATTPSFNMLRVEKNDLTPNIAYYRSGSGELIDDVTEDKTYKITVSVEASTNTVYSYSDGALTNTDVSPINNEEYGSNKIIGLGNRDATVSSYPLFGHIKNFKIFDKALTEFEVSLL